MPRRSFKTQSVKCKERMQGGRKAKKTGRKIPEPINKATIRVQLDARTVITISSMSVFKMWKSKYPEARVLDS